VGKHERGYKRVEADFYPSPDWIIEALAEHIELKGRRIWEPACGDGRMAEALKAAGAHVYATDIIDYGYAGMDELFDFTSEQTPKFRNIDAIITNPPTGKGGRLAVKFIASGLWHTRKRGSLALLLPPDFDSGVTRQKFFADCPRFAGKVVLLDRPIWYRRTDGEREQPKENRVWDLWSHDLLRTTPVILYARTRAPKPTSEMPKDT
jgi:hypothetical protein